MADPTEIISPWEKALMAAEKVKERVRRAAKALDEASVAYAIVGGNAVAEWVARADEGAVRNTRDVDLLIRRADFGAVRAALESAGFVYHQLLDVEMFLDGPTGRPSEAIHLLFANEKVRPDHAHPAPDVEDSERATDFQVTSLTALVTMKLLSWRDKGRTHLRDLIGVGLIDATWPSRFPAPLGERLQQLLDDPDG
jgi:hypothetical protein